MFDQATADERRGCFILTHGVDHGPKTVCFQYFDGNSSIAHPLCGALSQRWLNPIKLAK